MVIQCFPLPWFLIRRKVYCSLRMCKRLHFLWSNFLPLRHLGISYLVMRIFFSLHNLILLDSPALTWHDNFDFFFNHHHKKINGLGFENYWMIKKPIIFFIFQESKPVFNIEKKEFRFVKKQIIDESSGFHHVAILDVQKNMVTINIALLEISKKLSE